MCYIIGRGKNSTLANAFLDATEDIWNRNFERPGTGVAGAYKGMIKESQNLWKYYASGRINIVAMLVQISTCKRQDLLSSLISFFNPEEDTVTIEFALDDSLIDNFVFVICPKRQYKSIIANNTDLVSTKCFEEGQKS